MASEGWCAFEMSVMYTISLWMCSGHISHSSETTGMYVVKSAVAEHSMNAECQIKLQNMVILLTKHLYVDNH